MARPGSLFALIVAGFFCTTAAAQDKIFYKDGTVYPSETSTQQITVLQESYDVIKYELQTSGGKISQTVSTSKVDRIQYRRHKAFASAKEAFDAGNFEGAIEQLEPLTTKTSPHWVKQYALFYTAESLFGLGDYEAAIKAYEELESKVPDSRFVPEARLQIGNVHLAMNKYADAKSAFSKLKRDAKSKGFDEAYEYKADLGLIAIDEAEGKFSVALGSLEKLQSQVGDDYPEIAAECRLRIGNVYIREGDYDKAEQYFKAILEAGSASKHVVYGAYNGLGKSYFAQNEFKKALTECYLRVVVMDDRSGDVPIGILAESLFWAARCWDQLRDEKPEHRKFAYDLYREVVARAPGSSFAADAKKQMRR